MAPALVIGLAAAALVLVAGAAMLVRWMLRPARRTRLAGAGWWTTLGALSIAAIPWIWLEVGEHHLHIEAEGIGGVVKLTAGALAIYAVWLLLPIAALTLLGVRVHARVARRRAPGG